MIFASFNGRSDNFGDILIFRNLYAELVKYDQVYLLGPPVPELDAQALRFRDAFFLALKEQFFQRKPVLIVGSPGARFTPKRHEPVRFLWSVRRRATMLLWRLVSAKFHVAGISVDSRIDVNDYKHYESIGVRDHSSLEKLSNVGVNASFCPDMACLAIPKLTDWVKKDVLISLRRESPDNNYASQYAQDLESALPKVIASMNDFASDIVFYAQVLEDQNYNKELSSCIYSAKECRYLELFPKMDTYREVFQEHKFVISNRLHVLLPALSEGAVPIALISIGHSKIINLFTSYGFEWAIVYVDSEVSVESQIMHLLRHCEKWRRDNYETMCELKSLVEDYIEKMVRVS